MKEFVFRFISLLFLLLVHPHVRAQAPIIEGEWRYSIAYECPWGWKEDDFVVHLNKDGLGLSGSVFGGEIEIDDFGSRYTFRITGQQDCRRTGELRYSAFGETEYLQGDWTQEGIYNAQWGTGLCCNGRIRMERRVGHPQSPKAPKPLLSPTSQWRIGDTLRFQHVLFEMSKTQVLSTTSAIGELDSLVSMMKRKPGLKIQLDGHTDIHGSPKLNLTLSKQRVKVIKAYLTKRSISPRRIKTKAYGSQKPLVRKGTDKEREVNRRVEVIVLQE